MRVLPRARRLLIFATTQDKQVREMLELLLPRFERVLLTRYTNNPRGVPVEELNRLAGEIPGTPCEAFATPAEAWRRARELATPEHLVCIAGSFFLAAELRATIAAEAAEQPLAKPSPRPHDPPLRPSDGLPRTLPLHLPLILPVERRDIRIGPGEQIARTRSRFGQPPHHGHSLRGQPQRNTGTPVNQRTHRLQEHG